MARTKAFDQAVALQKAMHIFWDKGFGGASMSDLTEAMGLSRSSLYETFGDKQDLFHQALDRYIRNMEMKRTRILTSAASARQGLRDYLQGAVNFVLNEEHPVGCFYTNTSIAMNPDKRVQALMKQATEEQEEDFYRSMVKAKTSGEIGSDKDPRALAKYFVGLIRGISVVARIYKDRKTLEDIMNVGLTVLD